MPSELKRRVVDEVVTRGSSMNDVAVEILAGDFGVPFEPSGRRSPAPGATGVVVLRMPPELKRRIQSEASARGASTNDVIVRTLAARLDQPLERIRKEPMATSNG